MSLIYLTRVKLLSALALFAGSFALAAPPAEQDRWITLRVDPLLFAEADEVWGLIAAPGNPVGRGWNASDTPRLRLVGGTGTW